MKYSLQGLENLERRFLQPVIAVRNAMEKSWIHGMTPTKSR